MKIKKFNESTEFEEIEDTLLDIYDLLGDPHKSEYNVGNKIAYTLSWDLGFTISEYNGSKELDLITEVFDVLKTIKSSQSRVLDYDVEFTIESKKLVDVFSELNTFGSDLNIKCSETLVELNANGDFTKLKVNIPIDDLDEYVINEGEDINISFSLSHLSKMCSSMKLSSTINLSLSRENPMLLKYNLGDDSNVSFFIAPKLSNN